MYQVSHTSDDSYMYFVLQIILVNVHYVSTVDSYILNSFRLPVS